MGLGSLSKAETGTVRAILLSLLNTWNQTGGSVWAGKWAEVVKPKVKSGKIWGSEKFYGQKGKKKGKIGRVKRKMEGRGNNGGAKRTVGYRSTK